MAAAVRLLQVPGKASQLVQAVLLATDQVPGGQVLHPTASGLDTYSPAAHDSTRRLVCRLAVTLA